ncbi:capsule biosynthesis protein [Thalassovita sp.]|uniref:capsule biosynthesis protein n=1 Tax=Thalassovita sp. TaxID=1979401 RepID=UPI002B269416|nr:capsule biosynthesis protein [Thalassovita sp.]
MTMKPKAKKFRIRRTMPTGNAAAQPLADPMQDVPEQVPAQKTAAPGQPTRNYISDVRARSEAGAAAGNGAAQNRPQARKLQVERGPQPQKQPQDPAMQGMVSSATETQVDQEIDAIRKEGLTGRQLRMARRVAQKHGLAPTSDFDAVRLLRANGIDPFERSTMLELVVPQDDPPDAMDQLPAKTAQQQLPQTVPSPDKNLPSTELAPADRRSAEIMQIQRDIARRRQRKLMLLLTRLGFFIFLPTILVGWYFYFIASPLYATKAEFLILEADATGGSALGGLLSGTQFATNQDAIAVQSYLMSRDAMQRLDQDMGFKAHFSQDFIDPIKRLPPDASDETAYKLFKRYVKIGYDPTEGVIKMEVIAADPQVSAAFSEHLISYAEHRVDDLSRRKREDQMREARTTLEQASKERREAQQKLVSLQEGTLLDPEGEMASIRALVNNVEMQLQDKELQLQTQLNNPRPNKSKVQALETETRLLREELDRQKSRLNQAKDGDTSLAAKAAQIQMAQADLATADLFLQSALQNEKQTAMEANRQVRYLTTSVRPVAPDAPAYPRAFENTILAFLVLSGVYLMLSLTASILREQVSS